MERIFLSESENLVQRTDFEYEIAGNHSHADTQMNSMIASSINKKLILRSLTLKAQYCQLLIRFDPTTKTVPNDAKAESTIENI